MRSSPREQRVDFTTFYIYLGFPASRWVSDTFLLLHTFLLFISHQYTALLSQQLPGPSSTNSVGVSKGPISRTKGVVRWESVCM